MTLLSTIDNWYNVGHVICMSGQGQRRIFDVHHYAGNEDFLFHCVRLLPDAFQGEDI